MGKVYQVVDETIDEEIALRHQTEAPPPPSEKNPNVPKSLNSIVLKCLERSRERRSQSVEELLPFSDVYIDGVLIGEVPPPMPRKSGRESTPLSLSPRA